MFDTQNPSLAAFSSGQSAILFSTILAAIPVFCAVESSFTSYFYFLTWVKRLLKIASVYAPCTLANSSKVYLILLYLIGLIALLSPALRCYHFDPLMFYVILLLINCIIIFWCRNVI